MQKIVKCTNKKNIFGIRQIFRTITTTSSNENTSISEPKRKIEIPNRIPRGPTDILMALSATVGTDHTAAHYKYHDDPFLIPMSQVSKRTFAMAQEAGRKAAKWIREEHREWFQHANANPPIKAYIPNMLITEDSVVDETSLTDAIKNCEVSDAITIYNVLKTKGIDLSPEAKQSLLELVCFYNHEPPLPEESIEERWFQQGMGHRERQRKTWKDSQLADQLFTEIEPKTAETYSAIIRGLCKYIHVDRAWALYEDALQRNFEVDTDTFNAIIEVSHFLKESGELRWALVQDILQTMARLKIKPNLGTLNSILAVISTMGSSKAPKTFALRTLAEFNELGIIPSLATWYYMLSIFCRDRGPISHILVDILNRIENTEFEIRHPKDIFFFITAMELCRNHLRDKELAYRLDRLLHYGENYKFIGDSYRESIYYRHYFALLCQTEQFDVFMELYNKLVPNVYIPEPGIMLEILKAIEVNGALNLLPQIWSNIVVFDHINREDVIVLALKIMVENRPNQQIRIHDGLDEKFGKAAWDVWTKIEEQNEDAKRYSQITWTGSMLGNVLLLTCRAGEWEKGCKIFEKFDKLGHKVVGAPDPIAIEEFVRLCVANKQAAHAITAIQYGVDNGFAEFINLGKLVNTLPLNEFQRSKLGSLFGADILSAEK